MKTGGPIPPPLVCGLHTAEQAVVPDRGEDHVLSQGQCAHAGSISWGLERVKYLKEQIVGCVGKPQRVSNKPIGCKEPMPAVMMHVTEAPHLFEAADWSTPLHDPKRAASHQGSRQRDGLEPCAWSVPRPLHDGQHPRA
jgi:hypothetical protein